MRVGLDPPYELSVTGQVEEGGLFYPHLVLTTTYTTIPSSNRLVIHDQVENRGAESAEMQLLYHCNLGQPLLDAGSRIAMPIREVSPISPRAAEGMATLDAYAGPTTGFAEQVYCCDLLGDAAGRTLAMLYNHAADRALVLRFNRQELPCFTVWKNTGALEDGYVTGLEPATNYPNFKTFERSQGRVVTLPAGGQWETTWSLEVHDSAAAVTGVLAEIVSLQSQAKAIVHPSLHPALLDGGKVTLPAKCQTLYDDESRGGERMKTRGNRCRQLASALASIVSPLVAGADMKSPAALARDF